MKCPHRQTDNPEGADFYRGCAQPLQLELICPEYGYQSIPGSKSCSQCAHPLIKQALAPPKPPSLEPTSFAGGRYQAEKFMREGGKKKAYLAYDTWLDRDVAFALIKTEKLVELTQTCYRFD